MVTFNTDFHVHLFKLPQTQFHYKRICSFIYISDTLVPHWNFPRGVFHGRSMSNISCFIRYTLSTLSLLPNNSLQCLSTLLIYFSVDLLLAPSSILIFIARPNHLRAPHFTHLTTCDIHSTPLIHTFHTFFILFSYMALSTAFSFHSLFIIVVFVICVICEKVFMLSVLYIYFCIILLLPVYANVLQNFLRKKVQLFLRRPININFQLYPIYYL